jgi:EAL domain-containing protein (putative c-di-GMP-specific phosphodiesterase class I)
VGVAYAGPGEAITPELIRHADDAMYAAKRYRQAVIQVLTAPDTAVPPRPRGQGVADHLTDDLRAALTAETLDLDYQPIVRTADGRVDGVESLLRWHHPLRGPVPAQLTVAIAEQAGLVDELGDWIVRRSLRDRAGWPRVDGTAPLDLSLNLSAVQLLNPGIAQALQDAMEAAGADPTTIICEITESILVQDGARAFVVLDSLKKLGLRIALDDFGTGYSALTHLRRFPVDIVKIDRSLVERITSDDGSAAVVSAVVHLGHALGLSVVAEGVETPLQASRLIELGCDAAQGHHFARPMSAANLGRLLSVDPGNTILPAP